MALIEFKNVNKYYGDYHALRDINLEIEKGQVVVLLGPSGSGKSTLIRTINALESIDNRVKERSILDNCYELRNDRWQHLTNSLWEDDVNKDLFVVKSLRQAGFRLAMVNRVQSPTNDFRQGS